MPARARGRTVVVAGVVGAGLALAVTELVAGLTMAMPSLVDAAGAVVVGVLPGGLVTWAIETFGASDRLVLAAGVVAVVLAAGALAARGAARGGGGVTVYAAFALVGLLVATVSPSARLVVVGPVIVVAAVLGHRATTWLLQRASAPAAGSGAGSDAPPVEDSPPPDELLDVRRGDDAAPLPIDRRRFLAGAAALSGTAVALAGTGRWLGRAPTTSPQAGGLVADLPAPTRALPRPPAGASLDVTGLTPLYVPNEDFYRIDTTAFGPPRVDVSTWRLRIHGLVQRELELDFEQLVDRGLVEADVTIACVSNEVGGHLVGNARWTGVLLDDLLAEAGVLAGGTQVVGRAVDGFTVGFPTEAARDGRDALVAVAMNGEPLPLAHGFPARLVVPGLYGYVSATKWLSDIELVGWDDFDAYWVPRGWAKRAPVKTQSRIDTPAGAAPVPAGRVVVAGVAWAPRRGIRQVEVRVDEGRWLVAELAEPLGADTWVQWRRVVELDAGDHALTVRATDGTGATQPEAPTPPHPDGAEGWHRVRVRVG